MRKNGTNKYEINYSYSKHFVSFFTVCFDTFRPEVSILDLFYIVIWLSMSIFLEILKNFYQNMIFSEIS